MSKKKKRGSGGHPARVAAQRQRDAEASEGGLAAAARRLATQVGQLESAREAEHWAAEMHGRFWSSLQTLEPEEAREIEDPAVEFGEPLVQRLARLGDPGAAVALKALSELDDGELGLLCKRLLGEPGLAALLPDWAAEIGNVEVVRAASLQDPVYDDGRIFILEGGFGDGETLAVGVYVDHNVGRIAAAVLVHTSIEAMIDSLEVPDGESELIREPISAGAAAGAMILAIGTTDATHDPPVDEDYWSGRALALLLADRTPDLVIPEQAELAMDDRLALVEEFLAAPEGAECGSEDDHRVLMLAIDYAGEFTGDDPLRWSPLSVDIFMFDWVAEDPGTTDAQVDVMPRVMDAWVRFAGRRRGTPEAAVQRTCATIAELAGELRELVSE